MNDMTFSPRTPAVPPPSTASMRKLDGRAAAVFMALIDGLRGGDAKKLDNAPSAFMAVSVDCLVGGKPDGKKYGDWALYAVAHRYEANGDLVPDPDVEFYVANDPGAPGKMAVYPTAIDHGPLGYRRYVEIDGAGQPLRVLTRGQADLTQFCNVWMRNIAAQQHLGGY